MHSKLQHGYIPVSGSKIMIEPLSKPQMTTVPVEPLRVASEYTAESNCFLDISGPPRSRQGETGKRWQVFVPVSRSCSINVFTLGYFSSYDINLPETQKTTLLLVTK